MESDLTQTRDRVQKLREQHERRERTIVDLRMVLVTLTDRTKRYVHAEERIRSDAALLEHLDRLLRRHLDGVRPLGYLGNAMTKVDIEALARSYYKHNLADVLAVGETERKAVSDRDDRGFLARDPDALLEDLTADPFSKTLMVLLDSAKDAETETKAEAEQLYKRYSELLTSDDPKALVRGVSLVGAVGQVARLAVVGSEDDPVEGVRTELEQRRKDHVAALAAADQRLVDMSVDAADPFVTLDWTDPVAMLPVRLETRFTDDALKVRIYPESLHVDTHEDQLTEAEREWGVGYWTRLWAAGLPDPDAVLTVGETTVPPSALRRVAGELVVPSDLRDEETDEYLVPSQLPAGKPREIALELLRAFAAAEFSADPETRYEEVRERAWASGVERFGENRAAYVLEALAPVTDDDGTPVSERLRRGFEEAAPLSGAVEVEFPDVDMRPSSWTQTPSASLLPDRFVVQAHYRADGSATTTDWTDVTPRGSDLLVYERRVGDTWVRRVAGPVVREPLAVGPSPEAVAADEADATTAMSWMTDFDEAESAGVGISVPLPTREDYDPAVGFSKVVVTGAKTTMDADHSRAALADLLAATDHTDGLELLEPGTPTNNADEPAARSSARDATRLLRQVTGPSLVSERTDGWRLAEALGVPESTFAHVPGAGDTRDRDAAAMNRTLWPATIGYFARNLLVSSTGDERDETAAPGMIGTGPSDTGEGPPSLLWWLETYRDHFVGHVRAGGPFQTLRAGTQPYGLLPVSPVDVQPGDRAPTADDDTGESWYVNRDSSAYLFGAGAAGTGPFQPWSVPRIGSQRFVPELINRVSAVDDEWLDFSESVPSLAESTDLSEDELLTMLAMEATAFSYRRQSWLLGDDNPIYDQLGLERDRPTATRRISDDLAQADLPSFDPRIADLLFLGASMEPRSLAITDEGVPGYITTLLNLFGSQVPLRALQVLGTDPKMETFRFSSGSSIDIPRELFLRIVDPSTETADYDSGASLLRHVLRFATLQAAVAARVRLGATYGWATGEFVSFPAEPTTYGPTDRTVFDLFDDTLPTGKPIDASHTLADHPSLTAGDDFHDVLQTTATAVQTGQLPVDPALTEFVAALDHLTSVDPERLGRLTRETMDLASHRLDAWLTSVATRRLAEQRETSDGIQLAAYGFVEDLAPRSGSTPEYLLAPSLDQATTAAVLRSAHKARSRSAGPTEADALAVDCSPEQVRLAHGVMRGIRRGLALSELLGYRFERGLRVYAENHGLDLEQYLDDFRSIAPSVEGKLPRDDTTVETRRSDVVDGMALYRLWKTDSLEQPLRAVLEVNTLPADLVRALGGSALSRSTGTGVFPTIHRAMEAVNDVLLTEGVHHLVHGRPERAAAALEALSRGGTPPEPTVFDTPRSETGVTHRLVLGFGDADTPTTRKPWQPPKRALLEPSDFTDDSESDEATTDETEFDWQDRSRFEDITERLRTEGLADVMDLENLTERLREASHLGTTLLQSIQVRQTAEPSLDAWVGDLLPDPSRIGCTGEFQWERDRAFAVGEFETPSEAGTVTVDSVGFEPDVVQFTAVPAGTGDGSAESHAVGWGHGVFKRAITGTASVEYATVAAAAHDGTVHRSTVTDRAVELTFATTDGDGNTARVSGSVSSTTQDGFEMSFPTVRLPVDGPERVTVQYRALKLADPTSVRVGTFRTPQDEPTETLSVPVEGDAGLGAAGFSPDHVLLSACIGDQTSTQTDVGFVHGEAMTDETGIVQQSAGVTLDPAQGSYTLTGRDDAVLATEAGDGTGIEISVDGFTHDGSLDLTVRAPSGTNYLGSVLATYVAIESPTTETSAGESLHRPALGSTASPTDGETVTVDTGFRPGLIELRLLPGFDGQSGTTSSASTSVGYAAAALSLGAATSPFQQQALGAGLTDDSGRVVRSRTIVAGLPATEAGESVSGIDVRLEACSEDGFTLTFSGVPEGSQPIVQYRVWPETPRSEAFSVPLAWPDESRDDGVSLADLDLSPLDAVALTQGIGETGDSQLERRIGYFAFRNRPTSRPPVPSDATLDLRFTEPSSAHDVSLAEFIEVARRVADLLGEARPADASDLAHPSEAGDEGYIPVTERTDGTAGTLENRATEVESALSDLAVMLEERREVLSGDPNICDRVEQLEAALRAFRRTVPLTQVVDVTARLARDHPDETNTAVRETVLAELATVAEHVRAGPDTVDGVGHIVVNESEQWVVGTADVDVPTDLRVTVHSLSDAVRFDPQSVQVRTDATGEFAAQFDFDGVPVGTEFAVFATPVVVAEPNRHGEGDTEQIVEAFERLSIEGKGALLVMLVAESVSETPDTLRGNDEFNTLVTGAAQMLDDGARPLAVLWAVVDELGSSPEEHTWLRAVDDDWWRTLAEQLLDDDATRFAELVDALHREVLLERTFERPRPDDWQFVDEPPRTTKTSKWTFHPDEGELRQTSNIYGFAGPPFKAPGTLAVVGDKAWLDYRLTAHMTSGDDDAIGVVFRYQDRDNFYRFSMDAEREYRRLIRCVDGEVRLLWEDDTGFETDRPYRVTIDCIGTALSVRLDDEPLCSVTDTALEQGSVGLYCRANVAARFHDLTVVGREQTTDVTGAVYAETGRVTDTETTGGWRDLPAVLADQEYLPSILWLARVLPDIDPTSGGAATTLRDAVAAVPWDTVEAEPLARVRQLLDDGTGRPQAFDGDDLAAVTDLLALRPLDLGTLADAVRAVVAPAAWTGLTDLLTLTGDLARPDAQRPWRASNPEPETIVPKSPEGEVRARLERLRSYPRTDSPARYGAYTPPVRDLLAEGRLNESFVRMIERVVAAPVTLVESTAKVSPAPIGLLTGLHDLLHHAESFDEAGRVGELGTAADTLHRTVEASAPEVVDRLAAQGIDLEVLADGFSTHGDTLERAVDAFLDGDTTTELSAAYLPKYAAELTTAADVARSELQDRVLVATAHPRPTESFRRGVLESVRHLLLRVSYFGIYNTVPASAAGGTATDEETLLAQLDTVSEEILSRLAMAARHHPPSGGLPTVDGQLDRIHALLGESFVVLPPFAPTNPGELHATLTDDGLLADRYEPDTWLQRMGRVRDLPSNFGRIRTYADSLSLACGGTDGLRRSLTVGQLPYTPGADWLGRDGVTPSGGELSLAIEFANTVGEDSPLSRAPGESGPALAGLLIDEWVDRVPAETESVGLGLQYDDPSTRAPQSVLLAVPPTWEANNDETTGVVTHAGATQWTEILLERTLDETMDLIELRSVDLDAFDRFGHLLPMLCLPYNRQTTMDGQNVLPGTPSVDLTQFDWEGWF
ncbi:hypothetical protein [Haloferax sp. DFSO52]|uniref:hypothetical protein n=1 Tax=Haloferax sp. DFSO52 TaxID=3388505 RepID=UPI003A8B1841